MGRKCALVELAEERQTMGMIVCVCVYCECCVCVFHLVHFEEDTGGCTCWVE